MGCGPSGSGISSPGVDHEHLVVPGPGHLDRPEHRHQVIPEVGQVRQDHVHLVIPGPADSPGHRLGEHPGPARAAEPVSAFAVVERDGAADLVRFEEPADPVDVRRVVVDQPFDSRRPGPVAEGEQGRRLLAQGEAAFPETDPPPGPIDEPEKER